jgi:hypothetical protein
MNYWVKRNAGAKGPFSETAIEGFIESGRLPESVLVSESPEGPWEAFPIIDEDVDAILRKELVLKQKQQTTKAKRQRARRERGREPEHEPEENRCIIPYSQSYSQYYTSAVGLVCLLMVVALILSMRLPGDGFLPDSSSVGSAVSNALSGAKVSRVEIEVGVATITDDGDDLSHVKIECNNGLEIEVDWKRNAYNEFGYDIFEPTVNRNFNRLSVMIIARGVIAKYLRGEYN